MAGVDFRDADAGDFARILALNHREERQTSPLDPDRLAWLHGLASQHRVAVVAGQVVAFLLAFREGSAYDGANYRWFAQRHARFVYVDRIVVDAAFAGRGIARAMYAALATAARDDGIDRIVCEYNLDPPNPASGAFHARLGFSEAGTQVLAGGKRVSLQILHLPIAPQGIPT